MINQIYNEDCLETMAKMPDKSINGIITSPPYNMTTERRDCYYNNGYAEIDDLVEEQYLKKRIAEFKEYSRVLDDYGVICYNISYSKNNPILPILLLAKLHEETDLTLADIISWKKGIAIPFQTSPTKLSRIVELIYIIVKKIHLQDFRTNKSVSKINKKTGQKFYAYYDNIIEAKNNDKYKSTLKATFSQELVSKLIDIYFPVGSLIYDPFIGIGTTALACIGSDRKYVGSEIMEEFYNTTIERIKEFNGKMVNQCN